MPLADLRGYSEPFSPEGRGQIVGAPPWDFGVDLLSVQFRTSADEIRKLLPEPLELSRDEPDGAAGLPKPFGTDLFHTLHYPSADANDRSKPLLPQLVQTVSSNTSFGELWKGSGEVEFHDTLFDEHAKIAPKEILGAYIIPVGFRIEGTRLLHDYVKEGIPEKARDVRTEAA